MRVPFKRIVFLGTVVLFISACASYLAYNNALHERFGDETAHMMGGHFVLQGKELYKDLQFNHQPLNYYFSFASEYFLQPDNLYFYISRNRMAIAAYGLMWDLLMIVVFGPIMVIFMALFEVGKYWFSGQKLLGETLAAYPLVYVISIYLEYFLFQKKLSNPKLVILAIASFVAGFSLLPLWIVIVPINFFIMYKIHDINRVVRYLVAPFGICLLVLFFFVSPFILWKETVFYNTQYFVPASEVFRPKTWQMILFPFFVFVPPFSVPKTILSIFMVGFLSSGYVFYKRKRFIVFLSVFGLFILTNFYRVGETTFGSFHLLPWLGFLFVSELFFSYFFARSKNHIMKKFGQSKLVLYTVMFVIIVVSQKHLFIRRDLANDYYVQYSFSETYGRAVLAVKDENDVLLSPGDPLIYWVAKMDSPVRMLEFVPWAYPIPEYNHEIRTLFQNNPPEFVINTGLNPENDLEHVILKALDSEYVQIYHVKKPSKLFIHASKLDEITNEQWIEFTDMLFEKP